MRSWDRGGTAADDAPEVVAPPRPPSDPGGEHRTDGLAALSATDRCDACGAQAFVRVRLPDGGELLFCGHHGHEHAGLLRELGARIRDDSYLLAARH